MRALRARDHHVLLDDHTESRRHVEQVRLVLQHDLQLRRTSRSPHRLVRFEPRLREAVVGHLAAAPGKVRREVDDVPRDARHLLRLLGVDGRPVPPELLTGHAGLALGAENHLVHAALRTEVSRVVRPRRELSAVARALRGVSGPRGEHPFRLRAPASRHGGGHGRGLWWRRTAPHAGGNRHDAAADGHADTVTRPRDANGPPTAALPVRHVLASGDTLPSENGLLYIGLDSGEMVFWEMPGH